jgi:hypothetical protein
MDKSAKRLLILGAVGQFAVALLHYVIPFLGPWAYGYFGAQELTTIAEGGSSLPAIATIALAVTFTLFGLMGLSAAGVLYSLGIIRPILWGVGAIYAFRGSLVIVQIGMFVRGGPIHLKDLLFSLVALTIGVVELWGLWRSRPPGSSAHPGPA